MTKIAARLPACYSLRGDDTDMTDPKGPSCKLPILAAIAIAVAIWALLGPPGSDSQVAHQAGPEWSVARNIAPPM